jgi:hypothetical protein
MKLESDVFPGRKDALLEVMMEDRENQQGWQDKISVILEALDDDVWRHSENRARKDPED